METTGTTKLKPASTIAPLRGVRSFLRPAPPPRARVAALLPYLNFIATSPAKSLSEASDIGLVFITEALKLLLSSPQLRNLALTTDFGHIGLLNTPYPKHYLPTSHPPTPYLLAKACGYVKPMLKHSQLFQFIYTRTNPPSGRYEYNQHIPLQMRLWLLGTDLSYANPDNINPLLLSLDQARAIAANPIVKGQLLSESPLFPIPHELPEQQPQHPQKYLPALSYAQQEEQLLGPTTPYHIYIVFKILAEQQKRRLTKIDLIKRLRLQKKQDPRWPYSPLLNIRDRFPTTEQEAKEAIAILALLDVDRAVRYTVDRLI